VETHVIPALGGIKLRSLNAVQLDQLYGDLLRSGRRRPKGGQLTGLSTTTVRAVHVAISAALTHAVRKGLLARSVAKLADPPGRTESERQIWSAEDTMTFLEEVKTDRLAPLYLMALTTGLRRGELAGLGWAAVDLDAGSLTISAARVVVDYKVVESGPKTKEG
jgi:integrase